MPFVAGAADNVGTGELGMQAGRTGGNRPYAAEQVQSDAPCGGAGHARGTHCRAGQESGIHAGDEAPVEVVVAAEYN